MVTRHARIQELRRIVQQDVVDMNALRAACYQGIPDESNLRPTCWRLLLNCLPPERKAWSTFLNTHRKLYEELVQDFVIHWKTCANQAISATDTDHPLSAEPTSPWCQYFKDNEVLLQINKDVRRLRPEMSFFQRPTNHPCKIMVESGAIPLSERVHAIMLPEEHLKTTRSGANSLVEVMRKSNDEQYAILPRGQEAHWQVVERILFVYSKLNPGVKYVQGMNEIVGPIYYVFASDANVEWREHAEADSYFCFQNLMSEIVDNFIKTLDKSTVGIERQMNQLYSLLHSVDPVLHDFMTKVQELRPQYFAFRWLSLLFSQEFLLPDVICLWDTLIADPCRFSMLLYVALAMIELVRSKIMENDFSSNVRLLQNYPTFDIARIISLADEIKVECESRTRTGNRLPL
uniref:TBC1 domain family member 13 n=1 Tax=Trichuris muris TaxID=70415 RepID=A0A5S6R478_TRIMR